MFQKKTAKEKAQKNHAVNFAVKIVKSIAKELPTFGAKQTYMSNPIVGIACHGYSSEAEISMQSAQTVREHLEKSFAAVFFLQIKSNKWIILDGNGEEQSVPVGTFEFEYQGKTLRFDVIFNALHGSPGEDGKLAALLDFEKIPHTSCAMYPAALTFNKRDCIAMARNLGVPTAPSVLVDKGDVIDLKAIINAVGLPCFVKANRAGSSFGVFKASTLQELEESIPKAFEEDTQLLIEQALEGREISLGVVRLKNKITVLPPTEIITENDFFDYAAKYRGKSKEITPADIPEAWQRQLSHWGQLLYDKLGLVGITRSDFIFVESTPHLLEINTVPGMTQASIIPQQCAAAGLSLQELFCELVNEALQRNP